MRMTRSQQLRDEGGFTLVVALMTLTVSSLLIAAAFVAAKGDIGNTQHDLDAKRAYSAARAGLSNFLVQLNRNTELWETCPSKGSTQVPGGASNLRYSYATVPANGAAACSTSNPVATLVDFTTGSFRMKFTGTSGTPAVTRTIVAAFRRDSPLDFLWYSVYETLDPNTYADPASKQDCAEFLRDGRPSDCGVISWITNDELNGPMYTQDQYSICGSPEFGRPGGSDEILTAAPGPPSAPGMIPTSGCNNNAILNGPLREDAPFITAPPDNSSLRVYAQQDGIVYSGTVDIALNGATMTITGPNVSGGSDTLNIADYPIVYVDNGSCTASYSPYFSQSANVYNKSSTCGNVYVSGNYSSSLTIAAQNDIIIEGSVTTNLSGTAVMGMVANNFIRVMHGVTTRSGTTQGQCGSAANVPAQTLTSARIDAAVLALNHSFIVDNFDCGAPIGGTPPSGGLVVNGVLAQLFRGTVGTTSGGSSVTGYLKNYTYDDRLKVQQPPYLFDLASASWRVVRETSCTQGSTDPNIAC
jgi:Tfp pilus assembly protein PilX